MGVIVCVHMLLLEMYSDCRKVLRVLNPVHLWMARAKMSRMIDIF